MNEHDCNLLNEIDEWVIKALAQRSNDFFKTTKTEEEIRNMYKRTVTAPYDVFVDKYVGLSSTCFVDDVFVSGMLSGMLSGLHLQGAG